jgi:hypothetical protein
MNGESIAVVIDLSAAKTFMATHARLLDRRRFELSLGEGSAEAVLAALEPYRNPDGGYGHGLEPDLRSITSQTGAAMHAFEVFEDIAPLTSPRAVELCDWLLSVSLPDGGIPFALPIPDPAGCAPFWTNADSTVSSLQITAAVASIAHRVAAHDPDVARHPWLVGATAFCLREIEALGPTPHAIELTFALQLVDLVHDSQPEARQLLNRLGKLIPASGVIHVAGGAEDESMRPLDFAPLPDRPSRAFFDSKIIDAELRRLANRQRKDGGWEVDFANYSPAAELEWRGYMTVYTLSLLKRNGVIPG